MTAQEFAVALRRCAEWWEEHPNLPAPSNLRFDIFLSGREELVAIARRLGSAEKCGVGEWYYLRVATPEYAIEFNVPRKEVCVARIVGTTHVPKQIIPAHDEPILEWDCAPLLAEEAAPPPVLVPAAVADDEEEAE